MPGIQEAEAGARTATSLDRKSTRLNSSHVSISYAVFCLKKKKPGLDPVNIRVHHLPLLAQGKILILAPALDEPIRARIEFNIRLGLGWTVQQPRHCGRAQ